MSDERFSRLDRLAQIMRTLGASLKEERIVETLLGAVLELTGSQAASILLFDPVVDGKTAALHFWAGPNSARAPTESRSLHVENSAAAWVYRELKPLLIPDIRADTHHFSSSDLPPAFEARTLLAVPLVRMGKPLGVIEAINTNRAHYTEEDATILEMLAPSVVLALQGTRFQMDRPESLSAAAEIERLKGDFIAITSHEFRTPLGVILGHATLLREQLGPEFYESLDAILSNTSRLIEITDSLNRVDQHLGPADFLPAGVVSVTRIIEEVIHSFSEMASKRSIDLRSELARSDLAVEADGSKVAIALSSLVKNAILFIQEGGHIRVVGESIPDHVRVSVIDDGAGIPAADLPRIFESFTQLESPLTRRHGGLGLGLSVAKEMIEMQGGQIFVESTEGRGSNFSFVLPLHAARV